ncbi:dihydrofolate reductase [Methylomonas sp. AM2-LC]|uniref:dihydrofolate reductase n=1 Tax=Methylomonas sp. AM2-LC TaxID=3153301 RepID=UPI003266620F
MKISLIVAMASNRAIGINGQMPWHLSADLKHFKKITLGSVVLMGRKTFESIGRPLPNRTNIIISNTIGYQPNGCLVFNDIDSALNHCADKPEVFVIGGATLYQAMLAQAHFLYLTEIHKHFAGDTFFPEIDKKNWRILHNQQIDDDSSVDFSYSFVKLERICEMGGCLGQTCL